MCNASLRAHNIVVVLDRVLIVSPTQCNLPVTSRNTRKEGYELARAPHMMAL